MPVPKVKSLDAPFAPSKRRCIQKYSRYYLIGHDLYNKNSLAAVGLQAIACACKASSI